VKPLVAAVTASDTASSYEELVRSSAWLAAMPFEHASRGVSHDVFLQRLIGERDQCEDPRFGSLPSLVFVVLADGDRQGLERTLESLLLQTGLRFRIVLAAPDPRRHDETQQVVRARLASAPYLAHLFVQRIGSVESADGRALAEACGTDTYVTCLRAGDVLHPSAVASFHLELWNARRPADLYVWNEMVVDYGPPCVIQCFIRKPQLEWFTLLHVNYISHSFAMRGALLPIDVDLRSELHRDGLHAMLLNALCAGRSRAVTIPQYLFLRDARMPPLPPPGGRPGERLRKQFEEQGFSLEPLKGTPPYRLLPAARSRRVGVVIPFRDQPEPTCNAIRSVLAQQIGAELELILVDNRSRPECAERVWRFADSLSAGKAAVRMLEYDAPFNHSAECNRGAAAATGDVVVFLNNDAELLTPRALEQMSSWSLLEGVGTVGTRMLGRDGQTLLSAGISARLVLGADFQSLVAESRDPEFATYNRETFGNTFACAAVARRTLERVGALDEVNFPNGYNDVDYSLRCRRAGLVNLYLGTECVRHHAGLSRGRSDEMAQKLLLRRRYPEVQTDSLFQLEREERPSNSVVRTKPASKLGPGILDRLISWMGRRL
jgi:GT2 family glycosyltransferase